VVDKNAFRFQPLSHRGHVESYFIKANDPGGDRAVWFKATVLATLQEPTNPHAEGWAIAFDRRGGTAKNVAVKHSLPLAGAFFSDRGLGVRWLLPPKPARIGAPAIAAGPSGAEAGAAALEPGGDRDGVSIKPGESRGAVALREHRIAWDFTFSGEARAMVPFPSEAFYSGPFPKSKLVTPYPDLRFAGEVTVDGERWSIDGWRGMQGHNWGRGHADLYAWCQANVWEEDADFVLEGLSARVRIGPVLSPLTTLVSVRHRGVDYAFNRPLDLVRATGDVGLRRWSFSATGKHARIEGVVDAETDDLVGLYYPNPDGAMTYCLNTKLARARVRFEADGRPPLSLTTRAAALEIGTHDEGHGVRMYA
jgi:hypothetical protein